MKNYSETNFEKFTKKKRTTKKINKANKTVRGNKIVDYSF